MSNPKLFASEEGLVIDASAIISLNATGYAPLILSTCEVRVVVTNHVLGELLDGEKVGYEDGTRLQELAAQRIVEIVDLHEAAKGFYEQLVAGSASDTLDDGEAATLAFAAASSNTAAMVDERKAQRICAERHPSVQLVSAAEVILHPAIESALGKDAQVRAMVDALQKARMRVPSHLHAGVVALIGSEEAAKCPSLPRSIRLQKFL